MSVISSTNKPSLFSNFSFDLVQVILLANIGSDEGGGEGGDGVGDGGGLAAMVVGVESCCYVELEVVSHTCY